MESEESLCDLGGLCGKIIHNFVRPHFTLGVIPAVALGIMKQGFEITDILKGQI